MKIWNWKLLQSKDFKPIRALLDLEASPGWTLSFAHCFAEESPGGHQSHGSEIKLDLRTHQHTTRTNDRCTGDPVFIGAGCQCGCSWTPRHECSFLCMFSRQPTKVTGFVKRFLRKGCLEKGLKLSSLRPKALKLSCKSFAKLGPRPMQEIWAAPGMECITLCKPWTKFWRSVGDYFQKKMRFVGLSLSEGCWTWRSKRGIWSWWSSWWPSVRSWPRATAWAGESRWFLILVAKL